MIDAIGQVGFPIVVAGFLLWRIGPILDKLTGAIDGLRATTDSGAQLATQRDANLMASMPHLVELRLAADTREVALASQTTQLLTAVSQLSASVADLTRKLAPFSAAVVANTLATQENTAGPPKETREGV